MENNEKSFNMDEFNKLVKQIKVGSPVHKINFNIKAPNSVVGMHLMVSFTDNYDYLIDKSDHNDISDNTLLVFESRHVIECCQIIFGALAILTLNRETIDTTIDNIITKLLTHPIRYCDAMNALSQILDNIGSFDKEHYLYKNLNNIFKYIWFVPYGIIDEIAKDAIEEYKKEEKKLEANNGEGNNNK